MRANLRRAFDRSCCDGCPCSFPRWAIAKLFSENGREVQRQNKGFGRRTRQVGGQVALETLIILAAIAGLLVIMAQRYADVYALFTDAMGRKQAMYAAELIKDAMNGCPDVEIHIHFPYTLRVNCMQRSVYVGAYKAEIPPCTGGGEGRDVLVRGCTIEVT